MTHDDSLWVMLCMARYGHLFSCQRESYNTTSHHLENNSWEFHFHVWEAAMLWLCVSMATIPKYSFLMFGIWFCIVMETFLSPSVKLPYRKSLRNNLSWLTVIYICYAGSHGQTCHFELWLILTHLYSFAFMLCKVTWVESCQLLGVTCSLLSLTLSYEICTYRNIKEIFC